MRIRYNISTGDFGYGSLANPVEEGAQLTGVSLGCKGFAFLVESCRIYRTSEGILGLLRFLGYN